MQLLLTVIIILQRQILTRCDSPNHMLKGTYGFVLMSRVHWDHKKRKITPIFFRGLRGPRKRIYYNLRITRFTLWPPRCLTTQVNWVDRPAATVIFSNGEMKPGSNPVTAKKEEKICYKHFKHSIDTKLHAIAHWCILTEFF